MNIARRLLVLFLLALLPLAALETVDVMREREQRAAELREDTQRLLALVRAEQARLIDGVRILLISLSESNFARRQDFAACQPVYRRMRERMPRYLSLHMTDAAGVVRCTSTEGVAVNISDRPHVRQAWQADGMVVGEYLQRRTGPGAALGFGIPYRDTSGAVVGVMTALLDLDWLEAYLATTPLPANAALTVADRQGRVLARVPSLPGITGQPLPSRYQPLLDGDAGVVDMVGLDGVPRLLAYAPPEADGLPGLFMAVGVDAAAAMAVMEAEMRQSLAFIAAFLLLGLIGGWWAARGLIGAPLDRERAALLAETNARLAEQHDLLESVFEAIPDAVFVKDRVGRYKMVNSALARSFNRSKAEIIGSTDQHLLPPTIAEQIAVGERSLMAEGSALHFEETINRVEDGMPRIFRSSKILLRDASGTVTGLAGIAHDITDIRQVQQALADSERRYRGMVESQTDPVGRLTPDGRLSFVNATFCRIIGQSCERLIGQPWQGLVFEPDIAAAVAAIEQAVTGPDHRAKVECRLLTATGPHWFSWEGLALFDDDGHLAELQAVGRDIERSKQVEEYLRASELQFRTLANSIPQLAWMARPDGWIFWYNQKWYDYTGTTFEQVQGWGWRMVHHPDHIDRVVSRLQRSWDTGAPWEDTFPMRGRDGEYRWFLSRALPVRDDDGKVILWFGTNTDITEQLRTEEALQAAKEEAEQANLSKSKFLAAASHDLRQPMQSLFLFVAALANHVTDDQARKLLGVVQQSLGTLKALLDGLLDISRLDAGKIVPAFDSVALAQVVTQVAEAYAPVATEKGLVLRIETDACCQVRTDPTLLGRMVRNLVENAIRYTPAGSVAIRCIPDGDAVWLEVADTGIGIPPQHLDKVFEEFHQVGNPERDREQGLGLGLAIVQRLSRLLDHPVRVASTLGEGSTFAVRLPRDQATALAVYEPALPAVVEHAGAGRLALVVDDEATLRLGLRTILDGWGYDVITAESADTAMDALRAAGRRPDVVIADYRLREGRTGSEVIQRVRDLYQAGIPSIMLTGEAGPDCRRDGYLQGFAVVQKPVTPAQLGLALDRQFKAVAE